MNISIIIYITLGRRIGLRITLIYYYYYYLVFRVCESVIELITLILVI